MSARKDPAPPPEVDFATLDVRAGANAGFWLRLRDPYKGEPIAARLRLLGADADACHLKFRILRRRRQLLLVGMGNEEQEFAALLDLLEVATVGWEAIKVNGEVFGYAPERVRELYTRWPWVIDLADQAIANRANFSTSSAGS